MARPARAATPAASPKARRARPARAPAARRSGRGTTPPTRARPLRPRADRSRQVLPHVPRPELDAVAVGIRDVDGAPSSVGERDLLDLAAAVAQPRDAGVVVVLLDVERVVDVHAAAAARDPDPRQPQA